jgi:hypothetical protein
MDFSQLSKENHDTDLFKVFTKIDKIVSPKELKKVKQEKEFLIVQLSESHALIDSLRSENTMLFNIIDTLENKLKESEDLLKKFSTDNLKSMLCIHSTCKFSNIENDYRVDVKNQIFHTNVSYRNPCNIVNHQTNSIYKALTK